MRCVSLSYKYKRVLRTCAMSSLNLDPSREVLYLAFPTPLPHWVTHSHALRTFFFTFFTFFAGYSRGQRRNGTPGRYRKTGKLNITVTTLRQGKQILSHSPATFRIVNIATSRGLEFICIKTDSYFILQLLVSVKNVSSNH